MAKFCTGCGKELHETDYACANCGKKVNDVVMETFNAQSMEQANQSRVNMQGTNGGVNNVKKNNGLAIAGFVLSIISIPCCGLTSFLGIILSIIGLVQINKQDEGGKGYAIAGIIISGIMFLFLVVLYLIGIFAGVMEEMALLSIIGAC